MNHLYIVTGCALSKMRYAGTSSHFCGDSFENRFHLAISIGISSRHDAWSRPCPLLATRNADAHEVDAIPLQAVEPSQRVRIVGISSVDHDIAIFQQREKVGDDIVNRLSCGDEHHQLPWSFKLLNHFCQCADTFHNRVGRRRRFKGCAFLYVFVETNHAEAMIGHIQEEVSPHDAKPDHPKIKLNVCHITANVWAKIN